MLKQAREIQSGLAWLNGDTFHKTLKIRERSTAPAPNSLSFFAPDFSLLTPEPWLLGEECEHVTFERRPLPKLISKAEPSSAGFEDLFEGIAGKIKGGEFEKVVPMVSTDFEFSGPLSRTMFANKNLPGQFAYGFEFDDEGLAGVTPEILFAVEGGILRTMALAGTAKTGTPPLIDDAKEMHEHRLVIEHIRRELKALGAISIGRTIEREYGPLKHLFTPIEVKLENAPKFEELITHLHPTAALGGWPRKPAVEWLERQPFHATRRRFGAPFGFTDGERMLCVVAIRNVQWENSSLRVGAGCGIVRESEVLKEWKELELKRDSIFRALGVEL